MGKKWNGKWMAACLAGMFFLQPLGALAVEDSQTEEMETTDTAEAVDYFDQERSPVLLRYIIRKNNGAYEYQKEDDKILIYSQDGVLLTRFKYIPSIYGNLVLDASLLETVLPWDSFRHEAATDMFDTTFDAALAGWLTLNQKSQGRQVTFYVGNCYHGHYFTENPGDHAAVCTHESVPESMHQEQMVTIANGALQYGEEETWTEHARQMTSYLEYRDVMEDRPISAMTKMVTVSHTEYARDDIQNIYFSYRDRVYRDFWEDVAGYDATDYIYIPPSVTLIGDPELTDFTARENIYKSQNDEDVAKMVSAIRALLKHREDANIWIGTPGITSMNFNDNSVSADVLFDFVLKVKKELGSDIWNRNVAGIYINQEALYREDTAFEISRFQEMIGRLKTMDPAKKALWIPYYDLNENSTAVAKNIEMVSKIPNLFDYIIIQPGYFFFNQTDGALDPGTTEHRAQNISQIRASAIENKVIYFDEDPFLRTITEKPFQYKNGAEVTLPMIGLEMENQSSYFSNSFATREETLSRYTLYLLAGAEIKNDSPMAFYTAGDPHCNKEYLVYKFYGAEHLTTDQVKKQLDEGLNTFFDYVYTNREREELFKAYALNLYLAADESHTEESFGEVYAGGLVIPEFYRWEKANGLDDIVEYMDAGRLPDYFDQRILEHLTPKE